jgi:hypothetical protein
MGEELRPRENLEYAKRILLKSENMPKLFQRILRTRGVHSCLLFMKYSILRIRQNYLAHIEKTSKDNTVYGNKENTPKVEKTKIKSRLNTVRRKKLEVTK